MPAFILALVFGIVQVCLTDQLIKSFNTRNSKKIMVFFAIKFFSYAFAIGFAVMKFIWQISMLFCGFTVGVPLAAITLFVYKMIYKK